MAHEFTKLQKLSKRTEESMQCVEEPLKELLLESCPTTMDVDRSAFCQKGSSGCASSMAVEEGRSQPFGRVEGIIFFLMCPAGIIGMFYYACLKRYLL